MGRELLDSGDSPSTDWWTITMNDSKQSAAIDTHSEERGREIIQWNLR